MAVLFLGVVAFGLTYSFSNQPPVTGTAQLTETQAAEPFLDQIKAEPDATDSFNPNGFLTSKGSNSSKESKGNGHPLTADHPLVNSFGTENQAEGSTAITPPQSEAQFTESNSRKPLPQAHSISLNTSTVDDLTKLPDVGRVLAQRIIDYRIRLNGFTSIDELKGVKGIGTKRFEIISPYLKL